MSSPLHKSMLDHTASPSLRAGGSNSPTMLTATFTKLGLSPVGAHRSLSPLHEEGGERGRSPSPYRDVDHAGPLPLPRPVSIDGRRGSVDSRASSNKGDPYEDTPAFDSEMTTSDRRRLARLVLHTTRFNPSQQELVAKHFKTHSNTKTLDGHLDAPGLRDCLSLWNVPPSLCTVMFRVFDRDGSQSLDFEEYATALGVFMKGSFDEKLRFFFNVWDTDRSGSISDVELRDMLALIRQCIPEEKQSEENSVEWMLSKLDTDGNGDVSFTEFTRGVMRVPRISHLFHMCFGELF